MGNTMNIREENGEENVHGELKDYNNKAVKFD